MKNSARFSSVVRSLGIGLLIILSVFSPDQAEALTAAPIKLAWDASSDATVTGYALYYGPPSAPDANRLDVGAARDVTLSNLEEGSNYNIVVVAYNAAGVESSPSNIVQYTPPVGFRLHLIKQADGAMSIQVRAAPGRPCRIEYAPTVDSTQWQTLGNVIADANGNVVINDPPSSRPEVRFYRAVQL